jgi:hypothetical protein
MHGRVAAVIHGGMRATQLHALVMQKAPGCSQLPATRVGGFWVATGGSGTGCADSNCAPLRFWPGLCWQQVHGRGVLSIVLD